MAMFSLILEKIFVAFVPRFGFRFDNAPFKFDGVETSDAFSIEFSNRQKGGRSRWNPRGKFRNDHRRRCCYCWCRRCTFRRCWCRRILCCIICPSRCQRRSNILSSTTTRHNHTKASRKVRGVLSFQHHVSYNISQQPIGPTHLSDPPAQSCMMLIVLRNAAMSVSPVKIFELIEPNIPVSHRRRPTRTRRRRCSCNFSGRTPSS
mmetsp:Transcript_14834/g.32888  ORF Transcript_14834/g.32888 Transcript_14834/m.32888 type:complete len:205 (+) Transcript_14834:2114-2728(+)